MIKKESKRVVVVKLTFLFVVSVVIVGYVLSTLYLNLSTAVIQHSYSPLFDYTLFLDINTYIRGLPVTILIYLIFWLHNPNALSSGVLKNPIRRVEAGLENADWLTDGEAEQIFVSKTYSELTTYNGDGIPVNAIYKNKNLNILFAKPMHTLVLGATGSGKTTGFINPMIQMIANSAAGSSIVCTDPKGELFMSHSKFLKSKGYNVMVLDLRECYNSYRWNPLTPIYRTYQEYITAGNEIYIRKDSVAQSGLKLREPIESYGEEWYEYYGEAFNDKRKLLDAVTVRRQKLYDEAYEDLNDIISVICPIESEKDPIWDRGARSIVFAVALAMLEDSEQPELGMTEERYNFFNINKAIGNSENEYKELKKYFSGRSKLSRAVNMAKQVLTTAPETLASYMTNAFDKLSIFNDSGVAALTSGMDIDLDQFANQPSALFVKIPDEKDTRHRLAAVFMVSLYKSLVKAASKNKDLTLPRNVYYLLDEFGNMPKINKFESMITVGRSRKIWFVIVIQAYAQLDSVYGEKISEIIKGNCPYKVFIGSNDMKTCEDFSKACGNMTVSVISASKQLETKTSDLNISQQTQQRPLIYPAELQQLNNSKTTGNAIVLILGNKPFRGKFTPSYKCPLYTFGTMEMDDVVENAFYEDEVYYNLENRNFIVLGSEEDSEQTGGVALGKLDVGASNKDTAESSNNISDEVMKIGDTENTVNAENEYNSDKESGSDDRE